MNPIFGRRCAQPSQASYQPVNCPPAVNAPTFCSSPVIISPSCQLPPVAEAVVRGTGQYGPLKEQTEALEKRVQDLRKTPESPTEWKKEGVMFSGMGTNFGCYAIDISVKNDEQGSTVAIKPQNGVTLNLQKFEALYFADGHLYRADGSCLGRFAVEEDKKTNFAKDDILTSNGKLQRPDGSICGFDAALLSLGGEPLGVNNVIVNAPPPGFQNGQMVKVHRAVTTQVIEDCSRPGEKFLPSEKVTGYEAIWVKASLGQKSENELRFDPESKELRAEVEKAFEGRKPEEKLIRDWKPGIHLRRDATGYAIEIRRIAAIDHFSGNGLSLAEGAFEVVNLPNKIPQVIPSVPKLLPTTETPGAQQGERGSASVPSDKPAPVVEKKAEGLVLPEKKPQARPPEEPQIQPKVTKDDARKVMGALLLQQTSEMSGDFMGRLQVGTVRGANLSPELRGADADLCSWIKLPNMPPARYSSLQLKDAEANPENGVVNNKKTTAALLSEFRVKVTAVAGALKLDEDPQVLGYLKGIESKKEQIENLQGSDQERVNAVQDILLNLRAETQALAAKVSGGRTTATLFAQQNEAERKETASHMDGFLSDVRFPGVASRPASSPQTYLEMAERTQQMSRFVEARIDRLKAK